MSSIGARPNSRNNDDLNAAWLTQVMRADGLDVTVASLRRESLGEGVGLMSGLERLCIEYAEGDGPEVLILKRPSDNDANRSVASLFDLYRREVLFYRDVADRCAATMPGIYYADIDGDDFTLIVEDLSSRVLGDQIAGATLDQAQAVMRWMGRLHASFWDRVEDDTLEFLPMVHPSYSSEGLMQGAAFGWDPMVENFAEVIPTHLAGLKDRFLAALPTIFEWMATAPLTVIHGDVRMDNLFFGASAEDEPVVAVDWQGALRGRAAQDLGYFMGGNLPTEIRREHEQDLIGAWHTELTASGVSDYTADDAWRDYRRGMLFSLTHATVIAGTLDHTNERGRRYVTEMVRRVFAAIDDLALVELIDEILA
ncbi:MAG: phosphotransferase [Acidimicrobiales bacterium]